MAKIGWCCKREHHAMRGFTDVATERSTEPQTEAGMVLRSSVVSGE